MTIPMWMLLGFATWTLALLMAFVGVYRWVNILLFKAPIASFRSDQLEGADWYKRGTRSRKLCGEFARVRSHRGGDFGHRPRRLHGRCVVHDGPGGPDLSVASARVSCANGSSRRCSLFVLQCPADLLRRADRHDRPSCHRGSLTLVRRRQPRALKIRICSLKAAATSSIADTVRLCSVTATFRSSALRSWSSITLVRHVR